MEAADFIDAHRSGDPQLKHVEVVGDVTLSDWPFGVLEDVVFKGRFDARSVTFHDDALFSGVTFEGPALFNSATFTRSAAFIGVTFADQLSFGGATVTGDLLLEGCDLARPLHLGAVRCKRLVLDRATTGRYLEIDVDADEVSCHTTRFNEGVHLTMRRGDLVLDEAYFGRSSVVEGSGRARLVSMRAADVERLSLAAISLEDCRFAGVHNLDRLRLEGGTPFAYAPQWFRERQRDVLAEEVEWRRTDGKEERRWRDVSDPPPLGTNVATPRAHQIAPLYRALRKGREDAKNYPGAGDFYYGEMEMRRKAARARPEKWLLHAYWTVGYGVRPLRSFIAFLLVVLAFTLPIVSTGPHTLVADRQVDWLPRKCNSLDDVRRVAACVPKPLTYALNPLSPQARGRDEPHLPEGLGLLGVPYRLITIALFGLTLFGLRARVQR